MPFSAGELCCASKACVLVDTSTNAAGTWEKIPHVTEISANLTANTPKLQTSSTKGRETSLCGTVTQSGTISVACHKGTGPGVLLVNNVYRLVWAMDCDSIWDSEDCEATAFTNDYYEAYVRITSTPNSINISGNQATVYQYGFDVVSWVVGPEEYALAGQVGVTEGFSC